MIDNAIVSILKATIRILHVFDRIIVLIILIWPRSQDPLFSTALDTTVIMVNYRFVIFIGLVIDD